MTAPAPLDLGKPMRWKLDHTPVRVLWSDDSDVFAEWQPDDDAPVRQHMRTEWFTERAENIPPEPPRGPEEVWVSVYHNGLMKNAVTWTACASEGAALDMVACVNPARAGAAVRYIRADLATTNAAREVRPLTNDECQKLHEADTWCDLDSTFIAIMAARGIEVGE